MFAWKEKRDTKTRLEKMLADHEEHCGVNRRAIGLIPVPPRTHIREVGQSNNLKYHQLLISIEGNHQTCCLRVVSPRHKSRSAIMVFRGRVLGCLYGNKSLKQQLFGQEALERAMSDLSHPESILDAYLLPEDLVLAAGALFHGNALHFSTALTNEKTYESACEILMRSNMPGCVVINTGNDLAVCMVYLFGGRIVGVYSFKEGWVETSYEAGLNHLLETHDARVVATMLPCHNVNEVMKLTSSLTGLADRKAPPPQTDFAPRTYEDMLLNCNTPEAEHMRTALQLSQIASHKSQSSLHSTLSGHHQHQSHYHNAFSGSYMPSR